MCVKVISNVTDGSLTSTAGLLFSAHLRNMQEDIKIHKAGRIQNSDQIFRKV